ncbi:nuclear transport factor 2 family protein [Novosphingobium sp. FSY-8]|uniref:Nuclear transport factor 2 family protein n=1 Tax=Novosphingobium ovatum TaxID=1908523 RepID=A0ABW9XGE1_9SPHN|nr:nuclear transport factor 2 family protein [Novosphingobium ovatum]NBC37614.1 nuclear transport factor 2 family protein [Novosphingobium ovatum]
MSATDLSPIDRLIAIEAIRCVKARYFRLMDGKDWAALGDVFTQDAVFDARAAFSVGAPPPESADWIWHGRDAIVAAIAGAITTRRTVHHGHAHEITMTGPDSATGVIAMEDQIWDESGASQVLHGMGHYHETYVRQDGVWRIATSRLTRLHVIAG